MAVLIALSAWGGCVECFHIYPPVGTYIAVLAFLAAVVTIWPPEHPWGKALWIFAFLLVMVLEVRNLYRDRADHDRSQAEALRINREQFETTMRNIQAVLEANTEILINENKTLLQTMGGAGYPVFLPTYPAYTSSAEVVFPVKLIYFSKDKLPLIDVNVDLIVTQRNGSITDNEVIQSMFHSPHYNLGTILPGIVESPLQLQAGRSYRLAIATRRGLFYENIHIDRDTTKPGSWRLSWCLYRYRDNKLMDGKCE